MQEFRYCIVRTVEDGAVLNFPDLTTCPDGTACPDNPQYNITYKNTELTVRVCPNDVTPFWVKNKYFKIALLLDKSTI